VIGVCDAYDAMVSDRPYRAALSHAEALAELRRCAGTQFDPAVVRAFVDIVERAGLSAAA
jgi:HD-GYP domain-containing protein (c-di-GMP phosphodiesterase class II)